MSACLLRLTNELRSIFFPKKKECCLRNAGVVFVSFQKLHGNDTSKDKILMNRINEKTTK